MFQFYVNYNFIRCPHNPLNPLNVVLNLINVVDTNNLILFL